MVCVNPGVQQASFLYSRHAMNPGPPGADWFRWNGPERHFSAAESLLAIYMKTGSIIHMFAIFVGIGNCTLDISSDRQAVGEGRLFASGF